MNRLRSFIALFAMVVFSALVFAETEKGDLSLTRLMNGNKRFVSGIISQKDLSDAKRKELSKGQKPFAIVLTCSDSRVSPEIIFDQGLGTIFVVRVAGNIADPVIIRSIEYAAEHLDVPLLLILGHSQCGAVKATLELEGEACALAQKIMPAVMAAKEKGGSEDEIIEAAIKENIKNVYKDVMSSKVINHLVSEGRLKIAAGEYSLTTGHVEMIDLPKLAPLKKPHYMKRQK
ncbi:MAG: carbonic anhydrase [bacterium]